MSLDYEDLNISKENIEKTLNNCETLHDLSQNVSSFIFDLDDMQFKNVFEY